jgi:alkylhydroperoxidase/carboxymuconolactone decarboxylase family protein YurZ
MRRSMRLEDPRANGMAVGDEPSPWVARRIETVVLELTAKMTADSTRASSLDRQTMALVRIAALIAIQAPPAAYEVALGPVDGLAVSEGEIGGVLAAIAPFVGTARIASAKQAIDLALRGVTRIDSPTENGGTHDDARC